MPTSPTTPTIYDWALKLAREGTVIILDNVIRDGGCDARPGLRPRHPWLPRGFRPPRKRIHGSNSTALQTVGSKGWDGFVLARVKAP